MREMFPMGSYQQAKPQLTHLLCSHRARGVCVRLRANRSAFSLAEEKVWTVLAHNSSAPVTVQGSSPHRPHVMRFNYSASAEQLQAIVSGSEQCQQEVVYNCKKSRLFNTKGEKLQANKLSMLFQALAFKIRKSISEYILLKLWIF